MKNTNSTVFVLDTYNRFTNQDKVRRIFKLNGNWYAIYEVELEWGRPRLRFIDDENIKYYLFDTFEEANQTVNNMLKISQILF